MTNSHILTSGLKQRLLGGSSIAAIVLAATVAMMGTVQAQTTVQDSLLNLDGTTNSGQINNGFVHDGTATTHTVTIDLNDAAAANVDLGAITNTNSNAEGLVFDIIDSSAISAAQTLTLVGDAQASNNGRITFRVGHGTTDHVNFTVAANITETDSAVTSIVLGDNAAADPTINLNFASATATQTIDAAISVVDDADSVALRVGNSAVDSVTTFNDTITLGAGDTLTVGSTGGTSITGAIFEADIVTPGGLTVGGTTATNATFSAGVTSVGGIVIGGTAATDATFSGTVTATGGITLSGNSATMATFGGDVGANITLDATGGGQTLNLGTSEQTTTVTGNLDVTNNTLGVTLAVVDGASVTLAGDINSTAGWTNPITVGGGTTATTFTVQGDIADQSAITLHDQATIAIDSTGALRTVNSSINADLAGSTVTVQTTGDSGVNFATGAAIGTAGSIDNLMIGTNTTFADLVDVENLSVAAGTSATFQAATGSISGNITGAGHLIVGDAASDVLTLGGGTGTNSTISITGFDGPGGLQIAADSAVTINSTIGGTGGTDLSTFAMTGTDTTLTINSTDTTAITADGALTLNDGTIVLGSNIGDNDTVFDVASLTHGGTVTDVQLSVGFTNGTITLVHSGADQTGDDARFSLTNNALATYTIDTRAAGTEIFITAAARTADATATELGVSSEVANTVLQAVTSATAANDTTGLNALSAELNAGGARATQAANQIGVQADAVGAASGVAFEISSQQQSLASNRLSGLRGSYGQYASAFADTGISGGDLDGFYAYPPETRGSVWFEGFGGYAHADGNNGVAGYHAGFGGATAGVDTTINDQITVGVLGSYTHSAVDGEGAGDAQMETNTYQVALYGSYTTDDFYVDGFASYAYAETEASRTAVGETINGEYGSSQFALGIAAGAPLEVGANVYVTPNASLTWNHYAADDYTETGSLGFSARVTPEAVSQLTGTIGARIHAVHENFTQDGASLVPEVRFGLGYDLVDEDAVSTATFTGGGTSFTVTGTDTDNIAALLGVGVSLDHSAWAAGFTYDADIRSDFMSHTARAEYRFRF